MDKQQMKECEDCHEVSERVKHIGQDHYRCPDCIEAWAEYAEECNPRDDLVTS